MSFKEFVILVKELRDTQKEYFRVRTKEVLVKSINLEKQVDKAIETNISEGKNG